MSAADLYNVLGGNVLMVAKALIEEAFIWCLVLMNIWQLWKIANRKK